MATVAGLEQGYVVCPSDKRFLLLFTFLKKNRNKKVMVFFSSCMSVKFHHELLNYIDLACMSIHGKQKQTKRTTTFFQYCNADSGVPRMPVFSLQLHISIECRVTLSLDS